MNLATSSRTAIAVLAIALSTACKDGGPDDLINLAGTWNGNSAFGGTQSPATRLTLAHSGDAVSGTMRVTGAFIDRPIAGQFDRGNRTLVWVVVSGCEQWGGSLSVNAGGTSMSGPILVDRTGCASGQNSGGTLTLTKD